MNQYHQEFISRLRRLGAEDIRQAAAVVAASDALGWMRATIAIDRALRRQSRSVEAAAAARTAAAAVETAAHGSGLDPGDGDVAVLSQRAAECARGLVVAGSVVPHLAWLLAGWQDLIGYRLPEPHSSVFGWWWGGGRGRRPHSGTERWPRPVG